jgi:hypothetical protein
MYNQIMKEKLSASLILVMLIGLSLGCSNGVDFYLGPKAPSHSQTIINTETPIVSSETPSKTSTAVYTDTPVVSDESAAVTIVDCVTSILPENGSEVPSVGRTTFSWTPMDQASSYVLEILLPSGTTSTFHQDQTSYGLYMESFSPGGEYQWRVLAYDDQGNEICAGDFFSFEKKYHELSTETPEPDNHKNNSSPTEVIEEEDPV